MADSDAVRRLSARESAGVLADVLVPLVAEGLIIRRRRIADLLDRLDAQRRAIGRLRRLDDRYGPGPALVALPGRRIAFVLSPGDARGVLEQTPDPFAAATREKRAALSRFEPHGVLISSGVARARRRAYNEQILESSQPVHGLADRFKRVIDAEATAMLDEAAVAGSLEWNLFSATWWRVVRRIVLGDTARDDPRVTDELAQLRGDANWGPLAPRRRRRRESFLDRLRAYVARAEPGSLARHVAATHTEDGIEPVQQIPQWLFAFDAAGMASFRALALLDAHPAARQRVLDEIRSAAGTSAGEWPLIRGCVLESLRLWPTTPAILREATAETSWRNGRLPAGTALIVVVPYFHRDDRTVAEANSFSPGRWLAEGAPDPALMPFSMGPAQCPGRNLVLLTTSMLLARMLRSAEIIQSHSRPLRSDVPLPATLSPFRLRFSVQASHDRPSR